MHPHSIRAHGSSLRRLSHSISDARLGFLRKELEDLQSLKPIAAPGPGPERVRQPAQDGRGGPVEISHPWPEWAGLMERLLEKGYLDRSAFRVARPSSSSSCCSSLKDANQIRTACLSLARDRFDLISYFSRRDIQIMVSSGCPSLDRKVVNSGKRLRAHVGIKEGDVCSSCNLRERCERAYIKAQEKEGGRTVDIMRFLLTYGLDVITGSVENQACLNKTVKESAKKLLNEIVEFSTKEPDSSTSRMTSGKPLSALEEKARGYQVPKVQVNVLMKQGDWICPKCHFLNFAKNIKCLRCNGVFQERLKKLREEHEHLPLKKGDWLCEKCNFLNFAKNTRCLQCHEKPTNRQLNPGEWECLSCNYINFQRNMVCLKCDWKRPKGSYSGDVAFESQNENIKRYHKHSNITFVENNTDINTHHIVQKNCSSEGSDLWSSEEDGWDHDDDNASDGCHKLTGFDDFPIVGGRSAVSHDPLVRERWKGETLRRRGGISGESCKRAAGAEMDTFSPITTELDGSTDEDEIAGWFSFKSGKENGTVNR